MLSGPCSRSPLAGERRREAGGSTLLDRQPATGNPLLTDDR